MPDIDQILIFAGDWLKITHPSIEEGGDGQVVYVRIRETNAGVSTNPDNTSTSHYSDTIGLDIFNNYSTKKVLNWHNCYSFGNGVESNRITDTFNSTQLTPGVKVSTIFEDYKEEHRKYGLIYSGLYNSTSGVNNLNQFIAAEKITKDINPTYGSIQKLHTRDTDLVTLCEDKVLKILASKDAVYNADGNPQLTSTNRVLGQAVPFVGEYGISKNPESFVSEAYRSYFTDKQRGSVMRLSKDGLTPISMHGMKDWFRDNLSTSKVNLLGEDILSSNDNWDIPASGNSYVANGVATLGYYNNDIHDSRYGKVARLRKLNILEIGKKYQLQFDVIEHSGLQHQGTGVGNSSITVVNSIPGGGWISGGFGAVGKTNGEHVNVTWVANRTDFQLLQYQVNTPAGLYTPPGGTQDTVQNYVNAQRIADGWPDTNSNGIPDNNGYSNSSWLYSGIVSIANIVLEEVKVEPKIIGSYDDRQDEYNLTIHSAIPKTISFREDTKGWVSFKSFFPENAISCANDYYTIKNGKLWQHHIQGSKRNTFYNTATNSSVNVILNDIPSSIKSFHTLDYEGSQSRVEGIKNITVNGIVYSNPAGSTHPDGKFFYWKDEEFDTLVDIAKVTLEPTGAGGLGVKGNSSIPIKQYRNNILIWTGLVRVWNDPGNPGSGTYSHGRKLTGYVGGDFEVGDVITTEEQEKTVNHFNSMPKDGWYVSGIETDKQKGNLSEFIEKEGKWFNYIKGIDSEISETTDFGSFDIQGVGIIESTIILSPTVAPIPTGVVVTTIGYQPVVGNTVFLNPPINFDASHVGMNVIDSAGLIPTNTTVASFIPATFAMPAMITLSYPTTTQIPPNTTFTIFATTLTPLPPAPSEHQITFTDNINSSLQIGDTIYFEKPSEVLGLDLIDMSGNLEIQLSNPNTGSPPGPRTVGIGPFTMIDENTVSFNGPWNAIPTYSWGEVGVIFTVPFTIGNVATLFNIIPSENLISGKKYILSLEISNYLGSGEIGVTNNGGVSSNAILTGNGVYTEEFISDGNELSIFSTDSNDGTIQLSVTEIMTGQVFGFTRLESDNIQKAGVVTSLTNNTITIDTTNGTPPSANDYILFSKNQAINTSSLLGYYAGVKLENNSKYKAEIFSLSSEITESSK